MLTHHATNVGVSLLTKVVGQPAHQSPDTPLSRASSLPRLKCGRPVGASSLANFCAPTIPNRRMQKAPSHGQGF
ncbi:hypothetical protein E1508_14230 [Pseudomonas moraviensis]|nr:hypothetical protein E1508_14230 [Pseudomonas moraviensis]